MEVLRRLILVGLYVFALLMFGDVMSYPDDAVEGSRIKMTGVGVIVVVTFVVHKTINWVFTGAQKGS